MTTTHDRFLDGRIVLEQPARGHRAGTDAALLAAAAGPGGPVVDLGAGVGPVGLALARLDPAARVTLVEKDAAIAALARRNVVANDLAARVGVVEADIGARQAERTARGLVAASARLVVMNPPFLPAGETRAAADAYRAAAHLAGPDLLDLWCRTAASLLMPRGVLVQINRPQALPQILQALAGRFGDVRLRPVQPRADAAATRLLVRSVRGSRAALSILPPLILFGEDGRMTGEADAWHRGTAAIDWQL